MQNPKDRYSISFSIAYVRVCEWVRGEPGATRPKPEILDKALTHAKKLEDLFIIGKIREAYAIWENVNKTPTPRDYHPPPSEEAIELEAQLTKRFRVFRRPSAEVKVFRTGSSPSKPPTAPYALSMLDEEEKLDYELDQLLSEE